MITDRHGRRAVSRGNAADRPTVIYLAGFGRSGSTLVERLLGEMPGASPAGELTHMWQRGVCENERCGCGQPFQQCPFWRDVGQRAFGGWNHVDVGRIMALRSAVDRSRRVPLHSAAALERAFLPGLEEYVRYYRQVYEAIAQVSGSRVVIDSSKHASLAFCLHSSPDVDLRVLHLIRDSRAVAHSWSKTIRRPDTESESRMTTYPAMTSAVRWNIQNAALHVLSRLGAPLLRIRYEDLMRAPAATLHRMAEFAGLTQQPEAEFLTADEDGQWWAELSTAHTASGNPMRFTTGRIAIRRDDQWRQTMPRGGRRIVTAATLPLLVRYGYVGNRTP
jgi:hypothetical protein